MVYISNLSWDMDDQSLNDLFSQYQASDCVIVTDRNTGRSRGFGFATVPSQEMADSAIAALNDSDQFGRQIESSFLYRRRKDRRESKDREGTGTRTEEKFTSVTCLGGWTT